MKNQAEIFVDCCTDSFGHGKPVKEDLVAAGAKLWDSTSWYETWTRNPTEIWSFSDNSKIAIDNHGVSIY